MRLIASIKAKEDALRFSLFLTLEGIENSCDQASGDSYSIWVKDEDQVQESQNLWVQYQQNPKADAFRPEKKKNKSNVKAPFSPTIQYRPTIARSLTPSNLKGRITLGIVVLCFSLFFLEESFKFLAKLFDQYLLFDVSKSWSGFYPLVLNYFLANHYVPLWPTFESISNGQLWRLITPIFLHGDLFHLVFNMLWLGMLGKQIEHRLGIFRYLLLTVCLAIFSNTSQYLMTGPFFMGYLGVICGFLSFIWVRQKIAVWEGYTIHQTSYIIILVYIFAYVSLEAFSFFQMVFTKSPVQGTGFANTAHLMGGLCGLFMGFLPYFSWKR